MGREVEGHFRVPKTTLRHNDSLEKLTGLRYCYTHFKIYYSKRIQVKVSKVKRYMGQSQEKPNASFEASICSLWSCTDLLNSPNNDV